MNPAKAPPAPRKVLILGQLHLAMEPFGLARRPHVALDLVLQRLHQAWHGHHY
jgi:hypothetical protein